jgi:hypothetical protein
MSMRSEIAADQKCHDTELITLTGSKTDDRIELSSSSRMSHCSSGRRLGYMIHHTSD